MKQNNDLSRQLLILYCVAFVLCCSFTTLHCSEETSVLTGYWQGEYMPEQGFKLVLSFYTEENKEILGNVFLFQGVTILQSDLLSKIKLVQKNLSFLIEPKNTSFNGTITDEAMSKTGQFRIPDGFNLTF